MSLLLPMPRLLPPPVPRVGESLKYVISEDASPTASASVLVCGDWAPVREFSQAHSVAPEQLYGHILPHIRGADLSLVNLELPLASDQPLFKDGPAFAGDPRFAQALTDAGFHGVTMGNNHVRDQGDRAVATTLRGCADAGLLHVGAGVDREQALAPLIVTRNGLRIGILACTDPSDATATATHGGAADINDPALPLVMQQLRQQVDTIIVVAHGGLEYSPYPPPYWWDRLVSLVAYGADAVVAHHPHIPQGMNLVPRHGQSPAPILWSLGNFIFPPREADALKPPYMHLGFTAGLEIGPGCVHSLSLTPYHINNGQGLEALGAAGVERCARMIATLSAPSCDRIAFADTFAQVALRLWEAMGRERVAGLTAKLCAGESAGFQHGQAHFVNPSHYAVYADAIAALIAQVPMDREAQEAIEGWYAGTWPR
ncbi:MAG: CapA family protein [Planctomycetota bacterium]|nr:MAG: CapA family protein [Planctomycetota bacterium]